MAKKDRLPTETETIISAGVKVKGTLVSEGDVLVDGELKGSIKAGGNLTIGVNGRIEANISAQNVKVGGELTGNIRAEAETIIDGSGKVKGNIQTSVLSIAHGAFFSGQTVMTEAHQPTETEPEEEA